MCREKISVIIPVYNTEKYVEKAVRSVMDQTYRNLEIICVNDGSTDNSPEILQRLQLEDPRIVIVNKKNGGLGDARNSGLARSTSEWISFLDSDDYIQPDTYETVSGCFQYNPDMVYFSTNVIIAQGAKSLESDKKYYSVHYSGLVELNDKVIRRIDSSVCNKLFRKSVLDRFNIRFEKIYYEDFPFTMQYLFCIKNIYCYQERLYNYLRHPGSIMAETFLATPRAIDHLRAIDYLYSFLARRSQLFLHGRLLSRFFSIYYLSAVKYSSPERRQEAIDLAGQIYDRFGFLHKYLTPQTKNGCIIYLKKKRHHLSTVILQKLLSIDKEHIDYEPYKVVRIFNVIVYKRRV